MLNVAPVRIQGAGVARVHREVNVGDVITLLEAEHDESEIRTPPISWGVDAVLDLVHGRATAN